MKSKMEQNECPKEHTLNQEQPHGAQDEYSGNEQDNYEAALSRALDDEAATVSNGDYRGALDAVEAKEEELERQARLEEQRRLEQLELERQERLEEQRRHRASVGGTEATRSGSYW